MASRDLEENVYDLLQRIQLEQFYDKIHHVLHLTRLSHFEHVTEADLIEINMSKPEQRRLFDALKKYKKDKKRSGRTRFSFRKSKKKEGSPSLVSSSSPSGSHVQGKSCLINETSLKLREEIGDGAFGVVRKGEWTTTTGSKLLVAVKCLKYSNGEAFVKEQTNFMREASAMSDLDHPNVIHLYGVVLTTPLQLVMEYASLGSLYDRLTQEPQKFLVAQLCDFVLQVASGMSYLESRRFIHRDLATRNILLASYDKVKIGDFGLMRPLPVDEDIYVMGPSGKVPVAWCAPECLKSRQFSHASDVWAFGITVVEMFSYGKHPWDGLDASQILDIVDEPCCGRPSKPNHCPDQMFSLLIEHCWAHKPKDRSTFSCIKESLQQAIPEEVMVLFDLEADVENSEKLSSKSGDAITVMAWKCRMGKEFAKGQNKRTRQVGYFPSGQVHHNVIKRTGSRSRLKNVKVKDISPPLDNSFTHCAHRGNGDIPEWGTVMSVERQVVGKQHPLNLPSSLILLNSTESENRGSSEQTDADDKLNDACSTNALETLSLSRRDSLASNYSGALLNTRSCADSGYYSNRDTYMSQDYEPMTGSHAIAIPGAANQALCRQMMSQGGNIPGTYIPSPLQQFAQRTSDESPQSDSNFGQRHRSGSSSDDCERSPVRVLGSDPRPPLPAKQGVIGNRGYRGQPYENVISAAAYENMNKTFRSHEVPVITMDPSSPNSLYVNEGSLCFANDNFAAKNRRTSLDSSHSNWSNPPPCLPPRRKCSRKLKAAGICVSENGRCWSLPEADLKKLCSDLKIGKKASSFSTVRELPTPPVSNAVTSRARFQRRMTSAVDSGCWETRTAGEALTEEIYENIDTYIPGGALHSAMNATNPDTPPALPKKRCQLQRSFSEPLPDETGGKCLVNTRNSSPLDDGSYEQPLGLPQDFDLHPYAEISDLLLMQLRVDEQDKPSEDGGGAQLEGVADLESRGEGSGCEDGPQFKDSFQGISKDYADLDTMWAKLREPDGDAEPEPATNTSPCPPEAKLQTCVSDCQINENRASPDQDTLWKRNSADQYRIQRYARGQTCSAQPITNSSTSLEPPSSEGEGVQPLHKCVTLVTTV